MVKESKEPANCVTEGELWQLAFKRLVLWAMKRHRLNLADAEETVQEATRLFLASGGVADPTNPRALLDALGSGVNGVAVNSRRKKTRRAVTLADDEVPAEPKDPQDLEGRIMNNDIARRAMSALRERAGHDEQVFWLLSLMDDGINEPADQARELSLAIGEVYNARRRLKTHVESIKKLMETW